MDDSKGDEQFLLMDIVDSKIFLGRQNGDCYCFTKRTLRALCAPKGKSGLYWEGWPFESHVDGWEQHLGGGFEAC
jgi:hypothetical protein